MKKLEIEINEELFTELRLTSIHSKLPIERLVEKIVQQYYRSRKND